MRRLSFPWFVLLSVVVCAALACHDDKAPAPNAGTASNKPTPASKSTPPDSSKDDGSGLSCKTDADCPTLACGPCTPGTLITKKLLNGPSCARNPCKDAAASCNPKGRCVVHAKTKKDPAVWGSATSR